MPVRSAANRVQPWAEAQRGWIPDFLSVRTKSLHSPLLIINKDNNKKTKVWLLI